MSADIGALGSVDPHEVLGVRAPATPQQVTRAFHREALRGGHPDTGGDAHAFRRLVAARDALLEEHSSPGAEVSATPPRRPNPAATTPAPHGPGPVRPAPAPSDSSALPVIVLFLLFFVAIPHVLLAIVLVVVP